MSVPGLKTIEDALRIRSRVLLAFEKAENTADAKEREKLMTLVIVGGGPTGLELAGAFAELARTVLKRDFRRIDPSHARIILIEAAPVVLSHFPQDLQGLIDLLDRRVLLQRQRDHPPDMRALVDVHHRAAGQVGIGDGHQFPAGRAEFG